MPEGKRDNSYLPDAGRRTFLEKLWIALGIVFLAELIWIGISFLRPRKGKVKEREAGAVVTAGPVEGFKKGEVRAFPEGKFYLARLSDGGFLALSRECTHLGCTVPWVEDKKEFVCPCHSSTFDIWGDVTSPPAPRALDIFPVTIENNLVKVDTRRRIKRKKFSAAEVARPF